MGEADVHQGEGVARTSWLQLAAHDPKQGSELGLTSRHAQSPPVFSAASSTGSWLGSNASAAGPTAAIDFYFMPIDRGGAGGKL